MTIAGWILMAVGIVSYIAAFAQGPGPTMGDRPLQASLYSIGALAMMTGFILLVI